MELTIQVNEIIIKDKNSGKEHLFRTVRSVQEIYNDLDQTEREALENKMYEIADNYR
jgi:hypothetical protein